jgi:uroporphyrin-III C-methyltransferase
MTHTPSHHFGQVIQHGDGTATHPCTGPGHYTLIGAGSGDPALLNADAIGAIRSATVLLVDDLINETVVTLAQPTVRMIYTSKRGGVSAPQAFIEKLILMAVREGEQVVHLTGNNSRHFGRASAELAHLQGAGISVRLVDGIAVANRPDALSGASTPNRVYAS